MTVAELIEDNGSATSSDVMSLLSITDRGAQRLLKRLIEKGVVEKTGAGRSTRYKLSK